MIQVSRRSFIKLTSLLPVALYLKPFNAQACPLCFLVIDVLLGWAERGVAMESLEIAAANSVRSAAIQGLGKTVIKSVFSNTAKQKILKGFGIIDTTEETASIFSRLDKLAENSPNLVLSYNQYENDIQAWWFIKNTNEILIEITNPTHSAIDSKLLIKSKNKGSEDSKILFKGLINIVPDNKMKFVLSIPEGVLNQQGVKDIIVEVEQTEQTNISPIIKTVFVV